MAVDAGTYLGNILGESSEVPARRIVLQLIFSFISLAILLWVNTTVFIEAKTWDTTLAEPITASNMFVKKHKKEVLDPGCLINAVGGL